LKLIGYFHTAIVHSTLLSLSYSTAEDRFAACKDVARASFYNPTISGSSLPLCHGVRVPSAGARLALRPTLQSPKTSSARPFRLLLQVALKAGNPTSMCTRLCCGQPRFNDRIGVFPRRQSSSQAPQAPGVICRGRHGGSGDVSAGGAGDEVGTTARQEESVRSHRVVDILYPTDAVTVATVPAVSIRGAGFGLARRACRTLCWQIACQRGAPGCRRRWSVEDDWWKALL
jgi:hypothetical protein